jgi:hypothetical protein
LPTYQRLVYRDLWPGINLVYSGAGNEVPPGADPSRIRLAWRGATDVTADGGGALQVATGAGTVTDTAPVSYQNNPGGD